MYTCFYYDSAAALIINGNIISAVQEERFTRIKHNARFPINSMKYSLNLVNLNYIKLNLLMEGWPSG